MTYNPGYMTAQKNDEGITPAYAVKTLIPYLAAKGYKTVLCPFDTYESNFYTVLTAAGYTVRCRHISYGQDFFRLKRSSADIIVSNPPFSLKDDVLAKLYELGNPFAMLLPITAIQSTKRVPLFKKNGLEILAFDRRISFSSPENPDKLLKGIAFATAYFCKDLLPKNLCFELLKEEL